MAKRRPKPPAPAGIYTPGEPCPVCGSTLFVIREAKGARCYCCRSALYVAGPCNSGKPVVTPPAARGFGGYVRHSPAAFARQ